MTRKTCNNTHVGIELESVCNDVYGYNHGRLRYRQTVAHQRFTRRNSRFLHIDDLYRSDSTITKLFLKINDIALNQTLNNIKHSSFPIETHKPTSMARNRILRRQTSIPLKSPASPSNSDSCFQLRKRRHTSYINNFVDSSGDDDSNHTKPIRELRSTTKLSITSLKTPEVPEQKVFDSGRPKRQIKPKRLSLDNCLVVSSKNCFRTETRKCKLRIPNDKSRIPVSKTYSSDSEDERAARNKKRRETQLTRLNNEAENFLFPRNKDDSSADSSEDSIKEEDPKLSNHVGNNKNNLVNGNSINKCTKNIKYILEDESRDSTSSESSFQRKKRRLTQAESFILDNQQYYKFENPGSRLRYHGSYLPPLSLSIGATTTTTISMTTTVSPPYFSRSNGDLVTKQIKLEEPKKKPQKKYNLERLQFAFEIIPNSETWYETFHRQDIGEERYSGCCNSVTEKKRIMLPYELGSIQPLNPRRCYYAYHELRKSFLGESPPRNAMCITPDSCSLDTTTKTDDNSTADDTRSSADIHTDLDTPFIIRRHRRGRNRCIGVTTSKTPRKSPRQHASTLAILSNLIQPRKRKPKSFLSSIQEEQDFKPDYNEISKMFNFSVEDIEPLDVEPDAVDFNIHCKPSAVQALQEYLQDTAVPKSKALLDRKVVRKKRTNKTGWPNKCKRSTFKKEGSSSSGSIIDSTDCNNKGNNRQNDKLNCVKIKEKSVRDRTNCVNIDLAKWEKAERVLTAKLNTDLQPVVRVQKLGNSDIKRNKIVANRRPKQRSPTPPRMLRRHRNKQIN